MIDNEIDFIEKKSSFSNKYSLNKGCITQPQFEVLLFDCYLERRNNGEYLLGNIRSTGALSSTFGGINGGFK